MRLFFVYVLLLIINIGKVYGEPLPFQQAVFKHDISNSVVYERYPRFINNGIFNKEVQVVNKRVKNYANGLLERFLKGDDIGKSVKKSVLSSKEKGSFDVKYKIIRADKKYVSVRFDTYFYQKEALHGVLYYYGFNYDFKDSRVLKLADLFDPGTNYLKQILEFCKSKLNKQLGKEWYTITKADLSQFTFDQHNLTIHFNTYQLGSYAFGALEVKIPFKKLVGLKKEFSV